MPARDVDVVFRTEPLTHRCHRIRQRAEHALIGVSTGNSYFTAPRLTALVRWAQRGFAAVDVVCADLHIEDMLVAEGDTPENAARRARKRVRDVRRRIRQAVEAADPDGPAPRSHLLSEFRDSPAYRRLHAEITQALGHDPEFALACHEMVHRYVLGHGDTENGDTTPGDVAAAGQVRAGLDYLCSELPFFVDTPGILGVPSSVSCYHVFTPVLNPLFLRDTGLRAVEPQGFLRVAPQESPGQESPDREESTPADASAPGDRLRPLTGHDAASSVPGSQDDRGSFSDARPCDRPGVARPGEVSEHRKQITRTQGVRKGRVDT